MARLDRRECMKTIATSMAVLAAGRVPLSALPQKAQPGSGASAADFWKRVDAAKARALVNNALKAARAEVASQRALRASKRAAVLLGAEGGKAQQQEAETQYRTRTAALQQTKQALAQFVKQAGASGEKRFTDFLSKGGLKQVAEHSRKSSIQALLKSDVSPQEAESALKALDDRLSKVQDLKSFQDATSYLDQHLDELIGRKMSEEDPKGLCVLLLILSSVYVVLLLIAILICIFTFGLGCQGVLDKLIAQACP